MEIEKYNDFLSTGIAHCLNAHNPLVFQKKGVECKIYIGRTGIYLDPPDNRDNDDFDFSHDSYYMSPNDARKNGNTYALNVICDVEVEMTFCEDKKATLRLPTIDLGSLPLMVRSKECFMSNVGDDPGGYFIIKGQQKMVSIDILQREFEEAYLQTIEEILPRVAKYHKQQSKYSGEKLPQLFNDHYNHIFKCKNRMRRKFHILFKECGETLP
jgi:DNA-directed RNA polymerase beta subunit